MVKGKVDKFFKFFAVFVTIALIIFLIVIKIKNTEFPMGVVLVVSIIAIIVTVLIIFGSKIFSFTKKTAKVSEFELPEPISLEECYMLCTKLLKHPRYLEYIKEVNSEGSDTVGDKIKCSIYTLDFVGKMTNNKYVILINQHYPLHKYTILKNPNFAEIAKAKNRLAVNPESPPDVKTSTASNPLTMTEISTKEVIHKKEEEKKQSEGENLT